MSFRFTKRKRILLLACLAAPIFWDVFNTRAKDRFKSGRPLHTVPRRPQVLKLPTYTHLLTTPHKHKVIDLPDLKNGKGWRWLVAAYLSAIYSEVDFTRDIYVFGVARGSSIDSTRKAFREFDLPTPRVWGFDSFSGIPDESVGVSRPLGWTRGAYDSSVNRSLCKRSNSGGEVCDKSAKGLSFKEQVTILDSKLGSSRADTNYVQGYYNESLTSALYNEIPFNQALFIDIDCDLYISTFQALDWIFKHKIASHGTLIGYDDWCLTNLGTAGESRAHNEISLKYKVKFRCILGGCTDAMLKPGRKSNYYRMVSSKLLNPIFVVESIGVQAQSGMSIYPEKCISQSEHWAQV